MRELSAEARLHLYARSLSRRTGTGFHAAALYGAVVSVTGKVIKMRTDTVCIHGDTPGAVDIARGVRQALKQAGIEVAPFKKVN